jgi:hypothetical protein
MDLGGRAERKRCCECRRGFVPHAAAAGHQKTCSGPCRVERRRFLRRRRRTLDLREYRVDERERQRACRARKGDPDGRAVSRPGLSSQVPDLQRELLEIVDKQVEMSRAGLRREVARLLRVRAGEVGQADEAGP